MYHSIGKNKAGFTVSPDTFAAQVAYLKKHYTVVPVSHFVDMLRRGQDLRKVVAITIDDGYHDLYEYVLPIVRTHAIPVSVFIPTACVGGSLTNSEGVTLPVLTREHIDEMRQTGLIEFLPHAASHTALSSLTPEAANKEIDQAHDYITALNGAPPEVFAAPKGKYTDQVIAHLQQKKYRAALSVEPGLVHTRDERFLLPRNGVNAATTFAQFAGSVTSTIEIYRALVTWTSRIGLVAYDIYAFFEHVLTGKTIYRFLFNRAVWRRARQIRGRVLDVASGTSPSYHRYLKRDVELIVGDTRTGMPAHTYLDMDQPLPFPDEHFDAVLLFNALYIVRDQNALFRELHRVLRRGGRAYIASPFLVHEMREPHDYVRLTSEGLERLALESTFRIRELESLGERFTVCAHLSGSVSSHILFRPIRLVLYSMGLLLDMIVPRRLHKKLPATAGYFLVVERS